MHTRTKRQDPLKSYVKMIILAWLTRFKGRTTFITGSTDNFIHQFKKGD